MAKKGVYSGKNKADKFAEKGSFAGDVVKPNRMKAMEIADEAAENPDKDPNKSRNEGDPFKEILNSHDSPNTHEFYRPREWSGAYVGVDDEESAKKP